jgi:putative peptidoglycan lipid II flippase
MASQAKSTVTIGFITILSRITGLLRISVAAAALGQTISIIADAYNLANFMPNMVYELILGGVLTSVFVPVFIESKTKKSEQEAWEVANRILTLAMVMLGLMTVMCWIFTPYLVRIQALETKPDFLRLANFFFYFFAPQIIFLGMYAIFGAMLNAYYKFIAQAFVSILNNLVVIVSLYLYYYYPHQFGLTGLAIGTTLGEVAMALALLPSLYKLGWRYKWILDFKDPVIKKFFTLATPIFFLVALNQVAFTIRNNFADAWGKGGLTTMQNGYIFFQLPYGIFSVSIMTVLYPTLTHHAMENDIPKFRQIVSQGIRWSAFIIIPCAVGYWFLSEPIIRILLQHGKFLDVDTTITSKTLAFYALALLPYTLTLLFTRAFYALQDTKTPLYVVMAGVALTALGCWVCKPFGVPGVALGFGAQYLGMAVLFWVLLRRKIQRFEGRRIVASMTKSILASVMMGIAIYYLYPYFIRIIKNGLPIHSRPIIMDILSLSLTMVFGGIIYVGMTWLFRAEEFFVMKNWIQRRKIEL